jgi:hypothetical protein
MISLQRVLQTLALVFSIVGFFQTTFAGERAWSVEYLNSRQAEWDKLVGPKIQIEGRIRLQGKGQLRFVKCDLVFYGNETQLRPLTNQRFVEVTGQFQKTAGKMTFKIERIEAIPSDLEQTESRLRNLGNPSPPELYEIGEWAAERARFYNDPELAKKARSMFTNGVNLEWRALTASEGEERIALAHKAREFQFPDDQRMELIHEGYRILWQRILKSEKQDLSDLIPLIARLADDLPGSTQQIVPFQPDLKQRYEKDPVMVYRESPEETRKQLHRLFYASVVLLPIISEAAKDGQNGNLIANRIERAIPEEEKLAEQYRAAKRSWRLRHIETATRQEVVQLANEFHSHQLPEMARKALEAWLVAREDRLRDDGSVGLLQLAEDYLTLLQEQSKSVALLLEAYKIDPSFKDVIHRLESLGYTLNRGLWTKNDSKKKLTDPFETDTSRGLAIGITESDLRKIIPAKPESISRVITSLKIIEIWSYGPAGATPLVIRLERSGRSEARVVAIGDDQ